MGTLLSLAIKFCHLVAHWLDCMPTTYRAQDTKITTAKRTQMPPPEECITKANIMMPRHACLKSRPEAFSHSAPCLDSGTWIGYCCNRMRHLNLGTIRLGGNTPLVIVNAAIVLLSSKAALACPECLCSLHFAHGNSLLSISHGSIFIMKPAISDCHVHG